MLSAASLALCKAPYYINFVKLSHDSVEGWSNVALGATVMGLHMSTSKGPEYLKYGRYPGSVITTSKVAGVPALVG